MARFEIWEWRTSDRRAVLHGSATFYITWSLGADNRWSRLGCYTTRGQAERAIGVAA